MITRELITNSWYLSGIVSNEIETVSGIQISNGLMYLNELLLEKSGTAQLLPYISHLDIISTTGQEKYFIPNLVTLEEMTFTIDTVRFTMRRDSRRQYFGTVRANNIRSLPYHYYAERVVGGMDIYLYFLPSENYPLQLTGKQGFAAVTLDQDLSLVFDEYYRFYLKYLLANEMCRNYNFTFAEDKKDKLDSIEKNVNHINALDFTRIKHSTLSRKSFINYADVNLGGGWTTGGYN